jgi:iron complex transport system ATP-binding protein
MAARLRVEDVRWRVAGRDVLGGVTLEIGPGELVALLGRNGAGKSTLLDIIAGLREPDAGEVRLDERPLWQWRADAWARLIAHLPQTVPSDLPFRAGELVLMGRYPHTDRWFESDADRLAVEQAMRRTQTWELRHRLVQTLSGGERQRVLLAACFAQTPQILLLDEPATHLDVDQQLQCFSLLREESARGAACLAVTHDLNLALAYATRLVVIAEGRVAFDAPTADALRASDWLALFSPRLRLSRLSSGASWVSYA